MPRRAVSPIQVELISTDEMLDGPAAAVVDVLHLLNQLAEMRGTRRPPAGWQWTGADGRALRRAGAGVRRSVADIVVVPGFRARNGPHLDRLVERQRALCERLRTVHASGGHVLAFYTGVALVGEAGLLDERQAVVPWPFVASTLRHAPAMRLAEGVAWIEDGRVWTVDSPALATEALLRVLGACGLADLAEAGRSVLLHAAERQRLVKAIAHESGSRVEPGALERARQHLEEHLHEPYRLSTLARAAATSERSLLRHFRVAFGRTPLQLLHEMRVTRARMLLETTYLPVEVVAERCGWRDVVMLRKVFSRATGMTPASYRERFRLRVERRRWGRDLAAPEPALRRR